MEELRTFNDSRLNLELWKLLEEMKLFVVRLTYLKAFMALSTKTYSSDSKL